jgi:hypothetical protein
MAEPGRRIAVTSHGHGIGPFKKGEVRRRTGKREIRS